MKLIVVTLLALILFALAQPQCTYATLKNLVDERNAYIRDATFENFSELEFVAKISKMAISIAPCIGQMQTYVTLKDRVVSYRTDVCPYEPNTPLFNADPCCSPSLQDSKCCMARLVNETRPYITSFNNNKLKAECSNPEKTKATLIGFVRRFRVRQQVCNGEFMKKVKETIDLIGPILNCYKEVFQERPDCQQNDDCPGGVCNPFEGKCFFGAQNNIGPLAQCIFKKLPPQGIAFIRNRLGVKITADISSVRAGFLTRISTPRCIEPVGPDFSLTYMDAPQLNTSELCLAEKACTAGSFSVGSCPVGQFKCLANCGANGVCKDEIPSADKQQCESFGHCVGNGPTGPGGFPWNATTCAATNYCTLASRCNNGGVCSSPTCLGLNGVCLGFPGFNGFCQLPFTLIGENKEKQCPIGTVRNDFGCINTAINTQIGCTLVSGTWYPTPTNKASCEALKRCFNPINKQWSAHTQQDCTACGKLAWAPLFKWQPAEWKPSYLFKPQDWVNSTVVPKRVWGSIVDSQKLVQFLMEFIRYYTFPMYRDYFQCVTGPIVNNALRFSCDCGLGGKAPAGTNCFPRETIPAGIVPAFTGTANTANTPDVNLEIKEDSVKSNTDSTDITIEKEEPPTSATQGTLSHRLYDGPAHLAAYVSMGIEQSSSETAFLGSDGVKVGCAASGGCGSVNLCIKKDPESTVPVGYKSINFATISDAGVITKTSTTVTNSDDQVCGSVNADGSQTYYIAYIGGQISSGMTSGVALIVMIASLLITLF